MKKLQNDGNFRLRWIQIAVCSYSLIIIVKLFHIQVLQNAYYSSKADKQHWSARTIPARRGDILTKDGYPLATSKAQYLMFAEPIRIQDDGFYAKQLAPLIATDATKISETENDIKQKLSNKKLYWIAIAKNLSEDKKQEILKLNLKFLGFEESTKRFYPEDTLASHVVGYIAGSDKEEDQGYFGIEGHFDGDLRGKPGKIIDERSASGGAIIFGGYQEIPSVQGRSVVLTINRQVQFLVEQKLKEGVKKYGATSGTIVVMNPINGDIIAMANYPTYSPSEMTSNASNISSRDSKEPEQRRNIAISDIYEPGSIIKPLTVAAAVDLGLVNPNSTFEDHSPKVYSGHTIDNWNKQHHGTQTVTQLLEKSNNIGAAWVGMKVGAKNLHSYFKKFGLGEPTSITLEGESTGTLGNYENWYDIDLATASFGQGISATVLQMATAFCVFDNGGYLVKPRIVTEISDDKRIIEFESRRKRKVLSPESAKTVSDMLVHAVANGESKYFNVKDYIIAGKTGTAQIPVNGKYDANSTNTTFVGYLPNVPEDKKFVMVVKLERPRTSTYAAETAVPLWMDILRELVLVYKLPPDRPL